MSNRGAVEAATISGMLQTLAREQRLSELAQVPFPNTRPSHMDQFPFPNIDREWVENKYVADMCDQPIPNRGATEAGIISALLIARYCDQHGHKLRDAGSYANGETATDCLECERCGWYTEHTYY